VLFASFLLNMPSRLFAEPSCKRSKTAGHGLAPPELMQFHSENYCFLCSIGWFWQMQMTVTSRIWRQAVLGHRLRLAESRLKMIEDRRGTWCIECNCFHMWGNYVPIGKGLSECERSYLMDGKPIENCMPPPWVCNFGAGVVVDKGYRALLYLKHPYWVAHEIVTTAEGECSRFKASPNLLRPTLSEGADDWMESYLKNQPNWKKQAEARRALGGVKISRFENESINSAICIGNLGVNFLPRDESDDGYKVQLAAALFWETRSSSGLEREWLLDNSLNEIADHFCAIARYYFSKGSSVVVGHASSILEEKVPGVEFSAYWTRLAVKAHVLHCSPWQSYTFLTGTGTEDAPSMNIYFDGKWSFPDKANGRASLWQFIYNKLWLSSHRFQWILRGKKCYTFRTNVWQSSPSSARNLLFCELDLDSQFNEVFEKYALSPGAVRIANWRKDNDNNGILNVYMKANQLNEYVVSGAKIVNLQKSDDGKVILVLSASSNDSNFAVRIYKKEGGCVSRHLHIIGFVDRSNNVTALLGESEEITSLRTRKEFEPEEITINKKNNQVSVELGEAVFSANVNLNDNHLLAVIFDSLLDCVFDDEHH
jgi:hypothetical protein